MTVQTASANQPIDGKSWGLLALLALIWGGSFMFIGVAVKELPALLIVLARVGMAALILLPIHLILVGPLPRNAKTWIACGGMSIMNNAIPFTLISWGQHHITGGLASVVNATTPMFATIFMAAWALEAITLRKAIALVIGFVGVVVLQGADFSDLGNQTWGILAVVVASLFYGLSAPWSKKMLVGIPPMTTATCQLSLSTLIMLVIVLLFADPTQYGAASPTTWAALLGLAAISTSLAYLIFFRIIERAGPSFVSLVTMLVPVSAILLGYLILGESLSMREIIGALIIGSALVIIDGRILRYLGIKLT
jgi:drug/metabolite transporter (DMT)-like permease